MKLTSRTLIRISSLAFLAACSACASESPNQKAHPDPLRRGSGNADLEGPDAREVIRQTHRERIRQDYVDRYDRPYDLR